MNRPDPHRFAANLLDRLATLCASWFSWVQATLARRNISRVWRLRLLPVLVLSALAANCPGPTPTPPPKAGAWLVFLCQASDAPQEPHTVAFYQELFAKNQPDLLFDYFQKVSNGQIDLSGTEVYGWFKMTTNAATIKLRNNTTSPNRTQTAQDCRAAGAAAFLASNKSIDPNNYAGFIAVINVWADVGQAGSRSIVANEFESASFYAHEMLHVYGLEHSFTMADDLSADHVWQQGADKTYFDCWDMMSFNTCTFKFDTLNHFQAGPELEMAYREKLGWLPLPQVRIFSKLGSDRTASTVTLAPVSEPNNPGPLLPLMAKIETGGGARYVVEYRVPTGYDRAIPNSAVVIRELRNDGKTYLVTRQNKNIGWAQGEQFTDAGSFLSITVDAMTPQSATITINPVFATPAKLGEVCGNNYVGAMRPCPAGSTCSPRISPPLITIDYFCK
jgi:hypothetical protein